jgi:hypothetical protein
MNQSTEAGMALADNIADRLSTAVAMSRAIDARLSHWIEAHDTVEIGRLFVLHHDLLDGVVEELAGTTPADNIADRLNTAVAISRAIEARVAQWIEADDIVEIGRLFALQRDLVDGAVAELAGAQGRGAGAAADVAQSVASDGPRLGAGSSAEGTVRCDADQRSHVAMVLGHIGSSCLNIKKLGMVAGAEDSEGVSALMEAAGVMASVAGLLADRTLVALRGGTPFDYQEGWLHSDRVNDALRQLEGRSPERPTALRGRAA